MIIHIKLCDNNDNDAKLYDDKLLVKLYGDRYNTY